MNPIYNNRTYAVIPIANTLTHIKSNVEHGRLSKNNDFIIWDENWNPETLESMKHDPNIKLMNHKEALTLIETPEWHRESKIR